ncbi:MAG TPA: hypothetical protein VEH51_11145 [Burkholderiales bacterium]|nr:hypothetical protein [Burkholderiales bacterium]
MADHEDRKLSERYRELGREEPSQELDTKILAAARARPGLRRWALPLSIAAVIVLSVTVTLEVQREPARPENRVEFQKELKIEPKAAPAEQSVAPAAGAPAAAQMAPPAPALERRVEDSMNTPTAGRLSREAADRERFERAASAAAEERARQLGAAESPERWLERIAALRRAGQDDEADRLLAEFRRRFPDYRIPEATLKRVERR